jgi:hypothetical protein
MTMSPGRGGIFDSLLGLVRAGLGGTAGSGRQFVSWIHYRDFIRAIEYLIAHAGFEGTVNVCSPQPLPNSDFMRTETELILKSRRVVPGRLTTSGFEFQFPDWRAAAADLVGRMR